MCFSAQASFITSGLLAIIGALSIYKMPSKKYLMCALIPFLFAIQQGAEGIVWLTLGQTEYESLAQLSINIYIFFAWIVWPTWIPLMLWIIESDKMRKKLLTIPLAAGAAFSALALKGRLMTTLSAYIVNCHIVYEPSASTQWPMNTLLGIYALVVITPFFISSLPRIWFFGFMVLISLCASYIAWYEAVGSVWCFFAALISASILYFISQQKK